MSKINLTVQQAIDLNFWDNVCEYNGFNYDVLETGEITISDMVEYETKFDKTPIYRELEEVKKHSNDIESVIDILKDIMFSLSYEECRTKDIDVLERLEYANSLLNSVRNKVFEGLKSASNV